MRGASKKVIDLSGVAQAIQPWTDVYNLARPYSAIGALTPWQCLNNLLGNDT